MERSCVRKEQAGILLNYIFSRPVSAYKKQMCKELLLFNNIWWIIINCTYSCRPESMVLSNCPWTVPRASKIPFSCIFVCKLHFLASGRHCTRHCKLIIVSLRQLKEHGAESYNNPWGTRPQPVMYHCTCMVFGRVVPKRWCHQGLSWAANQHC